VIRPKRRRRVLRRRVLHEKAAGKGEVALEGGVRLRGDGFRVAGVGHFQCACVCVCSVRWGWKLVNER
jgi:hypothetical protein